MPETTTDGYLASLSYGDGSTYATSSSWTALTQVEDVQPPATAVDDIETKHLQTADHHKTFKAGWRDAGEVTAVAQYTAAQYATLTGMIGANKGWQVLFDDDLANPTAGSHDGGVGFTGYIKSLSPPLEVDGIVKVNLTIKVSGKPTVIAAEA